MAEPRIEYERRREACRAESARQMQRFRKVGILRIASLIAGLVLLWLVLSGLAVWWLLAIAAVFLFLSIVQGRITRARRGQERAAALYEQGLDRLNDSWAGKG